MGEVMFRAKIAPKAIDAVDMWLGRIPGRLSLLAVAGGTLFATLSGASMAGVAMLGTTLMPEMERRGYKREMSLGPILASGTLAVMIPPSAGAIILGCIAQISISRLLIAIIIPGLVMASLFAAYILIRCKLRPSIAPSFESPPVPLLHRGISLIKYVLPLGFVVFMVVVVIFLGVCTPTEAAATGALATFILAGFYRRLNWNMVKASVMAATEISIMVFFIIAGAMAFSKILAFSGATKGLTDIAVTMPVHSIVVIILMQVIMVIMGAFMDVVAIMMITAPIFFPVVIALGFDPIWFGVLMLINIEIGVISPPFGMTLFVMKSIAPPGTTMGEIYRAPLPFIACDILSMAVIMLFPALALWLPSLMRG